MDIIEQLIEQFERQSQKNDIKKAKKNYDEYEMSHLKNHTTFEDHLYYVVKTEILKWKNMGNQEDSK